MWRNVELKKADADLLRNYLKDNDIYYESSECGSGYTHFEIRFEDDFQIVECQDYLDEI